MNSHRPSRTFADYAAVAVCPVLIMLAVGSLVFFLVEIGYAGSYVGKLRWTLFWFVLNAAQSPNSGARCRRCAAVRRSSARSWVSAGNGSLGV